MQRSSERRIGFLMLKNEEKKAKKRKTDKSAGSYSGMETETATRGEGFLAPSNLMQPL